MGLAYSVACRDLTNERRPTTHDSGSELEMSIVQWGLESHEKVEATVQQGECFLPFPNNDRE